jgi:hypothetical protein
MLPARLAALCLLPLLATAQPPADTCGACAGAATDGASPCYVAPPALPSAAQCVWCASTTSPGQGYCAAASPAAPAPCSSASSTIRSAALCPALPPPITAAALTAGLGQPGALGSAGAVAALLLGLLVYSPLEGLQGAPPASTSVAPAALHVLYCAAVLLWAAAGLALATPTVPWLYLAGPSSPTSPSAVAFTAFSILVCGYVVRGGALDASALSCSSSALAYGGAGVLNGGDVSTLPPAYTAIAASAATIAACGASPFFGGAPGGGCTLSLSRPLLANTHVHLHPLPPLPRSQCTFLHSPRCSPLPSSPRCGPTT